MSCRECGRTDTRIRRGLCNACYQRHRRTGLVTRSSLPAAYVASEWAWLSSFGVPRDQVASQLGMSRDAFDKALDRYAKRTRQGIAA